MTESPGRVLALDIGSARVGAAISDPRRLIAQGLDVWPTPVWRDKFNECLEKYSPALVLVGLPLRTDGTMGPEGERISGLVDELKAAHPDLEFRTWDERFTTVIAQRALIEADVSRRGRKKRVDKVAATLILQSWLERENTLNS
jgi:putative Holliday junction resolvase